MKKQLFFIFFLLFLMLISSQSRAQSEISVNMQEDGLKSTSQARTIALSNTILSIGTGVAAVSLFDNNTVEKTGAILGVYGVILAPSTGNFYASDSPRGVIGMGARTVGAYLMMNATSEIFGRDFAHALGVDDKSVSLTDTKILIGEVLVVGSMIYNVLSTKASVEEYNQDRKKFGMNVTPAVIDDKIAPMLTASIRF
jgi:hypothetical protein